MSAIELGSTAAAEPTPQLEQALPVFAEGDRVYFKDTQKKGTIKLVVNTEEGQYLANEDASPRLLFPTHALLLMPLAAVIEIKAASKEQAAECSEQRAPKVKTPRAPRTKGAKSVRAIMTAKVFEGITDYASLRAAVIAERPEIKEISIKTMYSDLKHEEVIKI
jgi:hypothetical protein